MKNVIHHCAVSIAAMCCVAGLDAATGVDYLQTEGVTVEKNQTATQTDDIIVGASAKMRGGSPTRRVSDIS